MLRLLLAGKMFIVVGLLGKVLEPKILALGNFKESREAGIHSQVDAVGRWGQFYDWVS